MLYRGMDRAQLDAAYNSSAAHSASRLTDLMLGEVETSESVQVFGRRQ